MSESGALQIAIVSQFILPIAAQRAVVQYELLCD
jgi:hypothetical protein